jgi:MFS family permease
MVAFAASNFLGPLLLGRLFDTVGRIPMIAGTYLASAAIVVALGLLLRSGTLTTWTFMALVMAAFFFASAGASSAYLTVSEIFPMETRALAIAFFYAIGTAVGGITGPLLFAKLIATGEESRVAIGFYLGAGIMIVGGIVEILLGVKAEGRQLEDIATPLTAEDADDGGGEEERPRRPQPAGRRLRPGPARGGSSPGMPVSAPIPAVELSREVERIAGALAEHGPMDRGELARSVGARFWGPGRFPAALREAVLSGRARRVGRSRFAPADDAQGTGRFSRGEDRTGSGEETRR